MGCVRGEAPGQSPRGFLCWAPSAEVCPQRHRKVALDGLEPVAGCAFQRFGSETDQVSETPSSSGREAHLRASLSPQSSPHTAALTLTLLQGVPAPRGLGKSTALLSSPVKGQCVLPTSGSLEAGEAGMFQSLQNVVPSPSNAVSWWWHFMIPHQQAELC